MVVMFIALKILMLHGSRQPELVYADDNGYGIHVGVDLFVIVDEPHKWAHLPPNLA